MGHKVPKIPKGCEPKTITLTNDSFVLTRKRFSMDDLKINELVGRTWFQTPIIPKHFDQGNFPTCWAVSVCYIIHAYVALYTNFLMGREDLAFSPQAIIDGLACIYRKDVVKSSNWYGGKEHSYSQSTLLALEFASDYGVASMDEYAYVGRMMACKKFTPVVAPADIISWKMYQDVRGDDAKEVVSDEKIVEEMEKAPMLGSFMCFSDFKLYKGKGVYAGPSEHRFPYYAYKVPKEDDKKIQLHSVLVIGYIKHPSLGLVFECVTTNEDFGDEHIGYIARHLFISMESIGSIRKVID